MTFQENLRHYREQANITARDMAKKIGVKYTTYANYENVGSEPKFETLCKIAAALHVSTDDLLGYKPSKVDYWINYLCKAGVHVEHIQEDDQIAIYTGEKNQDGLSPYIPMSVKSFLSLMDKIEKAANADLETKKKQAIIQWFIVFMTSCIFKNNNFTDQESIRSLKYLLGNVGLDFEKLLKSLMDQLGE